jgi:DNA replication and repair protein RecF
VRAVSLVVRSFRNLADATIDLPESGIALVGPNGQGKTNCLEALAYPVLFRSVRGAADREIPRFGGPGFHVAVTTDAGSTIAATYAAAERRKRIAVDGEEQPTITAAIGQWLVVGFFPTDLALVQGGASERRRWIDRMLSLADREYLDALLRYRSALAQRNAALRHGDAATAVAFDPALARGGSFVTSRRRQWVRSADTTWRQELDALGEGTPVALRYRGDEALEDAAAWEERLESALPRDLQRGQTHVGPHRDDVVLGLGGHALRDYGSTGQQRSAAVALRLMELETLATSRGVRPTLLVDDVFAELDVDRQRRLAARLAAKPGQRIVTAPRAAEIPTELDLPRWTMHHGVLRAGEGTAA